MNSRMAFRVLVVGAALALAACTGDAGPEGPQGPPGPAGPQGPPGEAGEVAEIDVSDLSCAECHNDTTLIAGKAAAWELSAHGSGEAFVRGTSATCTGCHSGGGFSARIAAGQHPGEIEEGDPNPTRQDCRTCHQPRRVIDEAVDGFIEITSEHWGPHHGGQGSMLLGVAGAGDVEGSPSPHYEQVEGTCVTCHMGENRTHTYEPDVAVCQECHSGVEDFDINGVQTEVQAMLDELEEGLVALGWLEIDEEGEGHPAVDQVPEGQAAALWNWIYVAHEDGSLGVHNPDYTIALLEAGLAALEGG
jgi:hypothetical protein